MRDKNMTYASALFLSVAGGSTVIDLADSLHELGQAPHRMNVRVDVVTKFSGSFTSLDAALQDGATSTTFADTPVKISGVAKAALVAGVTLLRVNFPETGGAAQVAGLVGAPPPGPTPVRRFTRIYLTPHGGKMSAGAIDAWLEPY